MEVVSRKRWLPVSAILIFFSIEFLIFSTSVPLNTLNSAVKSSRHRDFHAPRQNVWAELTAAEVEELLDFLYDKPNDLNLTKSPEFEGWENDFALALTLQPNKSDVVDYLDRSGSPPERWAHVIVNERAKLQTRLAKYMVGPLGKGMTVTASPLTYPYNSGRHYTNTPGPADIDALYFGLAVGANVSDITMDLLGAKVDRAHPMAPDSLIVAPRVVSSTDQSFVSWAILIAPFGRSGEWSLLSQGIYIKMEGFVEVGLAPALHYLRAGFLRLCRHVVNAPTRTTMNEGSSSFENWSNAE